MHTILFGASLVMTVAALSAAQAAPVLGFDFSNAVDGQTVVAPSYSAPPVTAAVWNTGGTNGVESNVDGVPGMYSLTRFFGTFSPTMSFTLASGLSNLSLSFFTIQNHNYNFDSTYSVDVDLIPMGGVGTVLGSFLAGPGQTTSETLNFAVPDLAAGAYRIEWVLVPGSLGQGHLDTSSDYFGLTNVSLATIPEPGSLALAGAGLLMIGLVRRRAV